jgi:hypothetical protein
VHHNFKIFEFFKLDFSHICPNFIMTTPKGEHLEGLYHPEGKNHTSWVWKYFAITNDPTKHGKAKCCQPQCRKWIGYLKGTSSMAKHLTGRTHKIIPPADRPVDNGALLKYARKVNQATQLQFENALLSFVVEDLRPIGMVKSSGFVRLIKVCVLHKVANY